MVKRDRRAVCAPDHTEIDQIQRPGQIRIHHPIGRGFGCDKSAWPHQKGQGVAIRIHRRIGRGAIGAGVGVKIPFDRQGIVARGRVHRRQPADPDAAVFGDQPGLIAVQPPLGFAVGRADEIRHLKLQCLKMQAPVEILSGPGKGCQRRRRGQAHPARAPGQKMKSLASISAKVIPPSRIDPDPPAAARSTSTPSVVCDRALNWLFSALKFCTPKALISTLSLPF